MFMNFPSTVFDGPVLAASIPSEPAWGAPRGHPSPWPGTHQALGRLILYCLGMMPGRRFC